jgi:hypothetical protein
MSCPSCASGKVKVRCNPHPIEASVLADGNGNPLSDINETVLLIKNTRSGAGIEFEFNRQEEQP